MDNDFKSKLAGLGLGVIFALSPASKQALQNMVDFEKVVVSLMAITGREYDDLADEVRSYCAEGYSVDGAYHKVIDNMF